MEETTKGRGLRFFKEVHSDGVFLSRFHETTSDRWDRRIKQWIYWKWGLWEMSGIGGTTGHVRITEKEAIEILAKSVGKPAAEKTAREGL